jgi:hypothetical protein
MSQKEYQQYRISNRKLPQNVLLTYLHQPILKKNKCQLSVRNDIVSKFLTIPETAHFYIAPDHLLWLMIILQVHEQTM